MSPKNMITIPKDVRKKLKIKSGEYVMFYEDENGNIIIKKG